MDANKSIERLHQIQQQTNACITIFEKPVQHKKEGKLSNWSVAIKDNFVMKDVLTTAGSTILSNYIGVYDATVLTKLADEGVSYVAKTALDELGMGGSGLTCFTGPTKNPLDLKRQAGGSSSGSAAVMAANAVDLALGSDTGDSVRKPASYCGVVGVKPTYGRISRYGVIPYASSLDHVGYFTHNVMDSVKALEVMAGFDLKDPTTLIQQLPAISNVITGDLKGKKIAIFKNVIDHIDKVETKQLFEQVIDACKQQGALVSEVVMDEKLLKTMLPTYYILANCEATANHANLVGINFGLAQDGEDIYDIMKKSRTHGFNEMIRRRFVIGSFGLKDENQEELYVKAQKIRRLLVDQLSKALADVDVLIAPASSDVAPLLESDDADRLSNKHLISENHMVLGNFSGFPSMTIPMGNINSLPIGLNINAKAMDEQTMFDVALGLEKVINYKKVKGEV